MAPINSSQETTPGAVDTPLDLSAARLVLEPALRERQQLATALGGTGRVTPAEAVALGEFLVRPEVGTVIDTHTLRRCSRLLEHPDHAADLLQGAAVGVATLQSARTLIQRELTTRLVASDLRAWDKLGDRLNREQLLPAEIVNRCLETLRTRTHSQRLPRSGEVQGRDVDLLDALLNGRARVDGETAALAERLVRVVVLEGASPVSGAAPRDNGAGVARQLLQRVERLSAPTATAALELWLRRSVEFHAPDIELLFTLAHAATIQALPRIRPRDEIDRQVIQERGPEISLTALVATPPRAEAQALEILAGRTLSGEEIRRSRERGVPFRDAVAAALHRLHLPDAEVRIEAPTGGRPPRWQIYC